MNSGIRQVFQNSISDFFNFEENDLSMWICPKCCRRFRNTNQDHSCMVTDLESHFVNKLQNVMVTYSVIKNEVMKL
jgi:hypothetical protein